MDGIVETLLRLENAKSKALIEGNAPAYDESVRAQRHLLDSSHDLESDARTSPASLAELEKRIRLNTSLFLNLISTSAVFARNMTSYSASGTVEPPARTRIAVEA
jgi:hypothetical protein